MLSIIYNANRSRSSQISSRARLFRIRETGSVTPLNYNYSVVDRGSPACARVDRRVAGDRLLRIEGGYRVARPDHGALPLECPCTITYVDQVYFETSVDQMYFETNLDGLRVTNLISYGPAEELLLTWAFANGSMLRCLLSAIFFLTFITHSSGSSRR